MLQNDDRLRICVTRRLPEALLARLRAAGAVTLRASPEPPDHDELLAAVPGHDALVCLLTDSIDAALLEACARPPASQARALRLVAQVAVGLDNVDLDAARRLGLAVTHTPGVLTDATADLTFALLLAACRRVVEADRYVRAGRWGTWSLDLLAGMELRGATLGILGLGRIGAAVARRALPFGMKVLYAAPRRASKELEAELGAEHVSWPELLARSDVLSLHAPLDESTRGLVDRAALMSMKPGSVLVNTARGALVEEGALAEALERGPLRAAGLDVFVAEPRVPADLVGRDDVVLLPHIGSSTERTRFRMAEMAVEAVEALAKGEPIPHRAV